MLPKNYSQNKNNNKSDKKETVGVVLIIVCAFLLFCNILGPLVLGDIGSAIKNVNMGLLGYFSYPLYLCVLIDGIFMMQGKKMNVKKKYAAALIIIFIGAILIIQIASTNAKMTAFNSYVDYVFHGSTLGGLLWGIIAYGMAEFLTLVGAYVVLAFIIVGALLLVAGFFDKLLPGNVKKRKINKPKDILSHVKEGKTFKSDTPSLYIDTIISGGNSQTNNGNGRSFDSLPDEDAQNFGYNDNGFVNNQYSVHPELEHGVGKMREEQDVFYDDLKRKSEARKILFGDNQDYQNAFGKIDDGSFSSYNSPSGSSSSSSYGGTTFTSYHKTGSGSSSNYTSSYGSVFDDVVPIPPEKKVEFNYGSSGIINGDVISEAQSEPVKSAQPSLNMNDIKNSFTTETFGYNSEYNEKFISGESGFQSTKVSLPPIINGDFIADSDNSDGKAPIVYQNPDTKTEYPEFTPGPIIRGSNGSVIDYGKKEESEETAMYQKAEPVLREAPVYENEESSYDYEVAADDYEQEISSEPYIIPVSEQDEQAEDDYLSVFESESQPEEEKPYQAPIILGSQPAASAEPEPKFDDMVDDYEQMVEEEDEEALIDDQFEFEEEDEEAIADGLDEYEQTYGHPKFEGITEQESKILNDRFEKNSSLKIEDDVVDMSENSKFNDLPIAEKKYATIVSDLTKATINVAEKSQPAVFTESKPEPPKRKKPYKYNRPSLDLLTTQSSDGGINAEVIEEKKLLLEDTLKNLGIEAKVEGVTVGPAVTRYELNMPVGMSVKRIEGKQQDIRYGLACEGQIRVESPIPGKRAVGVEVPNDKIALVALRDIINSKEFNNSSSPLTIALGKDIQGKIMTACVDKMPHLLIAGTTGSGKSACLNSIIISILYKAAPDEVKLILVDPKCVEFSAYSGIPHMMIPNAITDSAQVLNAFKWLREEMDRRYKLLQTNRVRNIGEFNKLQGVKDGIIDKLPYIVVIVDEFADLMLSSGAGNRRRELEDMISGIAGKARAAGIHLILATQRPSADVITGTIKSNMPAVIAFAVSNANNSRIILDKAGAEALVGKGDMLYAPQDHPDGIRIQGSFVDNPEINAIADYVRENNSCEFDSEFENAIIVNEPAPDEEEDTDKAPDSEYDKDLINIVRAVIKTGQASGAMIQRRFAIGYMRASKIIDQMEELKFIGPSNGSKAREVYITRERFKEYFGEDVDEN